MCLTVDGVRWTRRQIAGVLGIAAALALAPYAWVRLAAVGHIYTVSQAPSAPVAIVFGAGIYPDGTPMLFLTARLDVARELYAAGKVRAILVSGDNSSADYDEPTAMQTYLVEHGIPADKVVRDFAGRDTYDSCVRARRIFGVEQAILVSQGYHVPRAVAICRAVGIDADGVGDWTTQHLWGLSRGGSLREVAAAPKAVFDLITGREPILGAPEDSLQRALNPGPP